MNNKRFKAIDFIVIGIYAFFIIYLLMYLFRGG